MSGTGIPRRIDTVVISHQHDPDVAYDELRETVIEEVIKLDVPEIIFGNTKRAPQLGIFPFRAFLNLAMLITESEKTRVYVLADARRTKLDALDCLTLHFTLQNDLLPSY